MPQDPRTWSPGDFVSSSYLNYDLYVAGAGYPLTATFVPNGIRWHAQRALYKCVMLGASQTLAASGVWKSVLTGQQPQVIIDNSGLYGAHMDPSRIGTIQDVILSSGGGLPGAQSGGVYLMSGFVPTGSTAGTNNVSCGLTKNAVIPSVWGTQQKAFPSSGTCTPFVLDLVDILSDTYTLAASSNGTTAAPVPTSSDGSGAIASLSALWVGTNVGTTTSVATPIQSWSSGSTVTAAVLNGSTGIQAVLRGLNYPPYLRAYDSAGVAVPTSTTTTMPLATTSFDSYSAYSKPTYTVLQAGLYLMHFQGMFANFSGQCMAGLTINGTTYWGPTMPTPSNGDVSCTKTQIFSLNVNDTITPVIWQNSGSTLTTVSGQPSRMIILKVGTAGVPSPLPTVPDVTYRYPAGLQPDLSSTFNAHLANDLNFLVQKPYLLSYQTSATTAIPMGTATKTIMQANTGIVHADNGDNYSGYNTSTGVYTCQRTGWYLGVGEIFMSLPSLTTAPLFAFQVFPTPAGSAFTSDGYQAAFSPGSGNPGGCTAVCYYHLRAGDTIYPGIYTVNSSSTTTTTNVSAGRDSHFELVWVSE